MTALMLPEHVEILKKTFLNDKKVENPVVDEQHFEQMNLTTLLTCNYMNNIQKFFKIIQSMQFN